MQNQTRIVKAGKVNIKIYSSKILNYNSESDISLKRIVFLLHFNGFMYYL
jgi:hypothetical protein